MKTVATLVLGLVAAAAWLAPAKAEILALVLYETKAEESMRSLQVHGGPARRHRDDRRGPGI